MIPLILALWLQSLDAYTSCKMINQGHRELNPLLGNNCKSIIINKSIMITTGYILFDNKKFSIALMASGAIGTTWNLVVKF